MYIFAYCEQKISCFVRFVAFACIELAVLVRVLCLFLLLVAFLLHLYFVCLSQFRAKKKIVDESLDEKRKRLQGKRTRVPEDQKDLKQFPCKRFRKGLCTFGDQCKYSHNFGGAGLDKGDEGMKEERLEAVSL